MFFVLLLVSHVPFLLILMQVMTHDNTDLAEMLLRHGADPNVQDKSRRAASSTYCTVAHDVAASGYTDTLRCLLRHGADVNLQVMKHNVSSFIQ